MSNYYDLTPEQRAVEAEQRRQQKAKMLEDYSKEELGQMSVAEELAIEARYGLYCGTCKHNLGCEHGVPAS